MLSNRIKILWAVAMALVVFVAIPWALSTALAAHCH